MKGLANSYNLFNKNTGYFQIKSVLLLATDLKYQKLNTESINKHTQKKTLTCTVCPKFEQCHWGIRNGKR